ncbi:MAG: tRNA-dependent cyclodipeptide synthase [Alphaproteobacteria bacterium]|nr:MAG: tRNA-dependent cyclodipeptide synthase [Alphaproteobacteria bacterium]
MPQNATRLTDQYSVRVKNGAGWRRFSRCRLMISVGQPYHESGKFAALVDWVNRNGFCECEISVNDTLQRYNLIARGEGLDQAYEAAEKEGREWVKRNMSKISMINITTKIIRWDDIINRSDYVRINDLLTDMFYSDKGFNDCVTYDATSYVFRQIDKGNFQNCSRSIAVRLSTQYILEELSAFCLLSMNSDTVDIYPGSNLRSAEYFNEMREDQCPPALIGLKNRCFTRIDFARLATYAHEKVRVENSKTSDDAIANYSPASPAPSGMTSNPDICPNNDVLYGHRQAHHRMRDAHPH